MATDTEGDKQKQVIRNTEHIGNYYKVNYTHLKWSFWASISALFIGLISLLCGIWFVLNGATSATSSLATIGGVLTQFIGAGFFFLYTKNLKQLNVFYEKLIKLQDLEYAIDLINLLPTDAKMKQISSLVSILITRNEPKMDFSPEMIKAIQEYKDS